MSAVTELFRYQSESDIRVVVIDDEPWFVLADICAVLDIANPSRVRAGLDSDALRTTEVIDSMGRTQNASIVDEGGLYEVIFQSRKPEAHAFRRWVTREVLPAIRKTGAYGAPTGLTFEEMTAHVIAELNARIDAARARAKELESPAAAWHGDPQIRVTAKGLERLRDVMASQALEVVP